MTQHFTQKQLKMLKEHPGEPYNQGSCKCCGVAMVGLETPERPRYERDYCDHCASQVSLRAFLEAS